MITIKKSTLVGPSSLVFAYLAALSLTIFFVTVRGQSTLIDELVLLFILPIAFLGLWKGFFKIGYPAYLLVFYFVVVVFSSVVSVLYRGDIPMAAPVIGVVLDSKFLIMLGALIFVVSRCKKTADEIVFDVCKAIILVGVVNFGFVVRDVFSGGVSLSGIELGRSNIIGYAPIGLFSHKINNALLFSMAFSAAIVLYLFKRKNVYLLLSGGFLVSLLLASSMKELAVLLSVLILLMKVFSGQDSKFKKSGRSLFVAALLLAPVLAFIFGSELAKLMSSRVSEYIFEENARAALYVASTQIANDYFPFGSGAGTFASQPSRSLYYSPIYYEYGVNFYYGASSEYSSFLMDVGWPKFLAEAGWLGGGAYFLAYFMALIGLVLSFLRSPSAVNMFGLMVGTVVFSSALGSAVFTGDMGLMACAILLFCRYLDKCKS